MKFVRKRDKRVKAYLERQKERDQERLRVVEKQRQQARRKREKMLDQYREQDWASMAGLEEGLEEMSRHLDCEFGRDNGDLGSQSEEEEVEQFYCVACDKSFKSDKALHNHEKSRKHKENVAIIKQEMGTQDEDDDIERKFYDQSFDDSRDESFVSVGELDLTDSLDLYELKLKTTNRHKVKEMHSSCRGRSLSGIEEDLGGVEVGELAEENSSQNENRQAGSDVDSDSCDELPSARESRQLGSDEEQFDTENKKEKKQKKKKKFSRQARLDYSSGDEEEKDFDLKTEENRAPQKTVNTLENGGADLEEEPEQGPQPSRIIENAGSVSDGDRTSAKQSSCESRKKTNKGLSNGASSKGSEQWTCNVCKANFPSRNKLFQHVKKQGHALRPEGGVEGSSERAGKKKGRKKK